MSYGWLTESAILPKRKKEIHVESRTVISQFIYQFIDLKVNLVKEKEKLLYNFNNKSKEVQHIFKIQS